MTCETAFLAAYFSLCIDFDHRGRLENTFYHITCSGYSSYFHGFWPMKLIFGSGWIAVEESVWIN